MIPFIGERAWKKYAKDLSHFPQKTVLGWSTGGLAAYLSATKNKLAAVTLLAPGIVPNTVVGEGLWNYPPNEITIESLTTKAPYPNSYNPHIERIRPNTPLKVPNFSLNLLMTAKRSSEKNRPRSS